MRGFARAAGRRLAGFVRLHYAVTHMSPSNAILATLREQCAPESHLTRLTDLVSLAEADSSLLALFLVGSYANGVGDRVSDLDLVAIASSGHGESVLQAAH